MRFNGCLIYGVLWICLMGASTLPAQDADEVPPAGVADTELEPPLPEPLPPELPELPETEVVGRPFPSRPLLEGEVVTATRTPIAAATSGSSVTVITGEQIGATEHTSVAEVLRNVEGLDVVRQGGPGGVTSVFIRGATPSTPRCCSTASR